MHPEAVGKAASIRSASHRVAVSATNGCAYCINSHTAAARKLGLDVEGR